jgi:pyruvate/2-oxoglutarate dehydrogenase complex dihydrolipoamide acyltransferase (E2) component
MSTPILLPKLGFSMEEGTISQWLIADGATVTAGQPLYALESEKSVQEIEAPCSGTLRIIEQAGGTFKVGAVIGEIA